MFVSLFFVFIILTSTTALAQGTLPATGYIDSPKNGSVISGQSVVRGWFLDGSGVSRIDVLIDGKTAGTAKYGIVRNDVAKVFSQYKNAYSGYQYTLDTTLLTNAKHSLTIKETSKKGSITLLKAISVNVQNLPAKGAIDNPAIGSKMSGDCAVSGWYLDGSGVSKIEVSIDGKIVGTAQYGITRNDVAKVYPQYHNGTSGYQYTLNTALLTNGEHTLTVKETSRNSSTQTLSRKIVTWN